MMNLSLITTALPSLGRFLMDLRPKLHTFPVDIPNDSIIAGAQNGEYTSGRRLFPYDLATDTVTGPHIEAYATGAWYSTNNADEDSTKSLVREDAPQGAIIQTTCFEVTEARC